MSLIKNTTCLKSRFSRRFVRALMKIKNNQETSEARVVKIKTAAEKSLALAVGSRRAWSRAVLRKIRHDQRKAAAAAAARTRRHRFVSVRRIMEKNIGQKKNIGVRDEIKRDEYELRKVVPGGEEMDLSSLLDETAHYLKCLLTQVQVMATIHQLYSASL